MSNDLSQSDRQQKQPKEPKDERKPNLFKKLQNPRTLFFFFRLGIGVYKVAKWLLEMMEL